MCDAITLMRDDQLERFALIHRRAAGQTGIRYAP